MAPPLKPVLLEHKLVPKVWGGRALERLFGLRLPAGEAIGESWALYDRPEGSSRIRGSGVTLRELMQEHPTDLLGSGVKPGHGGRFPLLIKYLDAREPLSVQVHPDDALAAAENDGGKNEAWVVLHAGPKARIIRGLRPGVSGEQFAVAAATAAGTDLLCAFRPEVGECVHLPAGTVHAIGPDVVVFEVQQNSDVTWRFYDWGRPREVQVDKALRAARLEPAHSDRPVVAPRSLGSGQELLVADPEFRVRRFTVASQATLPVEGRFQVLSVLSGRAVLGWHSGGEDAPLPMQAGDTALVPACMEQVFLSPIGQVTLLCSEPGAGHR